jgi:hypothetical protein
LLALWVGHVLSGQASIRYWDDGTLGGLLLILVVAATVLLARGVARGLEFDVLAVAVGSVVFGLYLFEPVTAGVHHVGAGSWLGACSVLVPLAALLTRLPRPGGPPITPRIGALTALMLMGAALVIAGIWLELIDFGVFNHSTYWNFGTAGHKAGICLLVLALIATVVSFGLWHGEPIPFAVPVAFAGTACGFGLFLPVTAAFGSLDEVGSGGWVVGVGGLALLAAIATASVLRLRRDSS